jgi:hypothetical protein
MQRWHIHKIRQENLQEEGGLKYIECCIILEGRKMPLMISSCSNHVFATIFHGQSYRTSKVQHHSPSLFLYAIFIQSSIRTYPTVNSTMSTRLLRSGFHRNWYIRKNGYYDTVLNSQDTKRNMPHRIPAIDKHGTHL